MGHEKVRELRLKIEVSNWVVALCGQFGPFDGSSLVTGNPRLRLTCGQLCIAIVMIVSSSKPNR